MQGEEHVPNPPKFHLSTCPSGTRNSTHRPHRTFLFTELGQPGALCGPTRERPAVCCKGTGPGPTAAAPHLGQCDGPAASPAGRQKPQPLEREVFSVLGTPAGGAPASRPQRCVCSQSARGPRHCPLPELNPAKGGKSPGDVSSFQQEEARNKMMSLVI